MISNFIAMFGNTVQSSSQGSAASAQGGFGSMLPLILIFGAMILLMIIPQRKKEKKVKQMLSSLKRGDKIETTGGIRGVISSVKDNTVIVKVASGVKIEFAKDAIRTVINASSAPSQGTPSSDNTATLNIKPVRKGEENKEKAEEDIKAEPYAPVSEETPTTAENENK